MRTASRLFVATFLFVGGLAAGRWASAQAPQPSPSPLGSAPTIQAVQPNPPGAFLNVISGNDVGFRIDSYKRGTPVGTLVVRINGQWTEVEFGTTLRRLTSK